MSCRSETLENRTSESIYLVLNPRKGFPPQIPRSLHLQPKNSPRVSGYGLLSIRIEERNEEEGDIVLEPQSPVSRQVNCGKEITITILSVGDQEFVRVDCVMDIPSAVSAR